MLYRAISTILVVCLLFNACFAGVVHLAGAPAPQGGGGTDPIPPAFTQGTNAEPAGNGGGLPRGNWTAAELEDLGDAQALIANPSGPADAPGEGDPDSGGANVWEGRGPGGNSPSIGGHVNTLTGNKLTIESLLGWSVRGEYLGIDLSLSHNSLGKTFGSFGNRWLSTYDVRLQVLQDDPLDGDPQRAMLQWSDGKWYAFTLTEGEWVPQAGVFLKLTSSANIFTVTTKDQIRYTFDILGFLAQIKDRNDNQVTINRTSLEHFITSVVDPTGRTITFNSADKIKVDSISDPLGRVWTFNYSAGGDLSRIDYPVVDSQQFSRYYAYNADSQMVSETDRRGKVWTFDYYSPSKKLKWWKFPVGAQGTCEYTYQWDNTTYTMPRNSDPVKFVKHIYANKVLQSETDASGQVELYFQRDSSFNVLQYKDKDTKVWTFTLYLETQPDPSLSGEGGMGSALRGGRSLDLHKAPQRMLCRR